VSLIVLQLFIAGRTPRAERAIATLRHLCAHELSNHDCDLIIVDVLTDPQQAEDRRILATPTLIKLAPLPQRRVIGDLARAEDVLTALNLPPPDEV
jgi:circadian clock protein KaiB